MQYAFMIAGLIGVLSGTRCSAKTLILISAITFLTSILIAYASGHSAGDAIDVAIALICTQQTAYYVSRSLAPGDAEIAQGAAWQNRENFAELERLLGIYIGDLGAVQPGSPEESMHMELGTLPDPGRFETKRGAGQQPVRKQSRAA